MALVNVNNRPARVNNWIDGFFNEFPATFGKNLVHTSAPAVNVVETENSYLLQLQAPGFEKTDFNVQVEGNLLTISAEKTTSEETKEADKFIRKEFVQQSFKRSFTLDEKIDATTIGGKYENGILYVTLPKKAETKATSKSIDIQ